MGKLLNAEIERIRGELGYYDAISDRLQISTGAVRSWVLPLDDRNNRIPSVENLKKLCDVFRLDFKRLVDENIADQTEKTRLKNALDIVASRTYSKNILDEGAAVPIITQKEAEKKGAFKNHIPLRSKSVMAIPAHFLEGHSVCYGITTDGAESECGLPPGTTVICCPKASVNPGDFVAIRMINGRMYFGRWFRKNGVIVIRSSPALGTDGIFSETEIDFIHRILWTKHPAGTCKK